jgi:DNA repair exonuclease SbcCD ATPase subunit
VSWFSELFCKSEAALEGSADLDVMAADARSPRAGRQQRCSVCGELGHKSPRHAFEQQASLLATIADLETQVAAATERAEISEAETRELWAQIEKLQDRLALAESLASMNTYGEGTRI